MNTKCDLTIKDAIAHIRAVKMYRKAGESVKRDVRDAVIAADWDLIGEDGDIKVFRSDQYLFEISSMVEGTFVLARITDGKRIIDFWVLDGGNSAALYDLGTDVIIVGEELLDDCSIEQLMGVLMHESYHAKVNENQIKSWLSMTVLRLRGFIYLVKLEEFLADRYAAKHGYGKGLAEFLANNYNEYDDEYPNVYVHLLKSVDEHPPTLLRVRYLMNK